MHMHFPAYKRDEEKGQNFVVCAKKNTHMKRNDSIASYQIRRNCARDIVESKRASSCHERSNLVATGSRNRVKRYVRRYSVTFNYRSVYAIARVQLRANLIARARDKKVVEN